MQPMNLGSFSGRAATTAGGRLVDRISTLLMDNSKEHLAGCFQALRQPVPHKPCCPPHQQGPDAITFLESLVVGDIQGLSPGTGTLSVFTNDKGGIIDDTVITKVRPFKG